MFQPKGGYAGYKGYGTPEQIDRKRQIADALMSRGLSTAPVQHWTQGAAQIAQALLGRRMANKADAADKQYQDAEKAKRDGLIAQISENMTPQYQALAQLDPNAALSQHRADQEWKYGVKRDGLMDQRYESEYADSRADADRAYQAQQQEFAHRQHMDQAQTDFRNRSLAQDRAIADRDYDFKVRQAQEGSPTYLSPDELRAAGYPDGAVVQRTADGNDQVRHKPQPLFTAGQQNKFRNDHAMLSQFDATVGDYISAVEEFGLQAFDIGGRNADAAKLDALRQDLLFQGKGLWELGVLSKDDYENMERALPDATGVGAAIRGKDAFMASIEPLQTSIRRKMNVIPPEYHSQDQTSVADLSDEELLNALGLD